MLSLVGKTIVAIKAHRSDRRIKNPRYIIFDDRETYIELEDQDYYSYHDCDPSAKYIVVRHDKNSWENIMDNKNNYYPDADQNYVF